MVECRPLADGGLDRIDDLDLPRHHGLGNAVEVVGYKLRAGRKSSDRAIQSFVSTHRIYRD